MRVHPQGHPHYHPNVNQENPCANAILVVDDQLQLLQLLIRVLERAGYRVLSATDAQEAISVFRERHREIGLSVLDVNIPPHGIDEVLTSMLELKDDLQVILTSGDELPDPLRDRLNACGGVFLSKPFSPKTVVREVGRVLGESKE
jgi:DNA-binding NtrC family response regulator